MSNRSAKYKIGPISESRAYEILRSPVITEKATMASEHNKVVFEVATDATKPEIKQAVEKVFDVDVLNVNVLNQRGKTKFFRGRPGRRKSTRKAVITVKEGDTVDIATGL